VVRVAAAYALVAWIVVEVAAVLLPTLLLPEWSVRLVTVLALLGFPIALDVRFQALLEHMSSPRSGE